MIDERPRGAPWPLTRRVFIADKQTSYAMPNDTCGSRPVGLTRDVGFQVGARKTLPVAHEDAWHLVTSPDGVAIWLGAAASDVRFENRGASKGEVRICSVGSHVRLTW